MSNLNFRWVTKVLDPDIIDQITYNVKRDIGADTITHSSIEELFPLLSDPFFDTDYIFIDVESFYDSSSIDVFEIINTLNILIRCTVTKKSSSTKPTRRSTKIVALVGETTPINLIKEILKFPAIAAILARAGGSFTYQSCLEGLKEMLNGNLGPSKQVISLLKKPKAVKQSTGISVINLTPRERQIMDLICTKGASNKIIARTLGISESTVKLHVGHVFKKYGVRSRTQLAVFNRK